jgi:hypothetical protein
MKQYLSHKSTKFRIRTYKMYDATAGNLWPFLIYAGKDTKLGCLLITPGTNVTITIVLNLVERVLKQDQTVWMDNYYNSPCLAKTLRTVYKTDCVSVLNGTEEVFPK